MNNNEKQTRKVLQDVVNQGLIFFLKHHKNTHNMPMSFYDMPYLYPIYKDKSPKIVIQSSVQTGKSEFELIRGMSFMRFGLSVFHVFSTGKAKNSFVKTRINDLVGRVPAYQAMERDGMNKRNMVIRNLGEGVWKFAVSGTSSDFDEFPADVLMVDEEDSCNEENLAKAIARMENSIFKFQIRVGNPTVKSIGISDRFDKSTKNYWYFKCEKCGKRFPAWNPFDVLIDEICDTDGNHVMYELYDKEWKEDGGRDIKMKCTICGHLQSRGKGKYESETKNKDWSGYHIGKMMKLNSPLTEMWEVLQEAEGNEYKLMVWFNKWAGLPYEGVGSKITLEMLSCNRAEYTVLQRFDDTWIHKIAKPRSKTAKAVAGVDVGTYYDMEIDLPVQSKGKIKMMMLNVVRCKDLHEVKEMVLRYNIGVLCIDAQPERNAIEEFQREMYGICEVIRIDIKKARSGDLKLDGFKEKKDDGVIVVDRTWLLDEAMKIHNLGYSIIPKGWEMLLNGYWAKSMCSITRIYDNEKEEYHWSKTDHDHFRFAHAFSMMAWRKTGDVVMIDDKQEKAEKNFEHVGEKQIELVTSGELGLFRSRYGKRTLDRRR